MMTFEKRWVGIIACGVGGLVNQGAQAEGFIEDSKANLLLRNFYVNADNRSGTAKPSRQEEWGQGFVLDFRSGLTPGPIGFGVDALGMLGVRLDSGKGRHYNANSDNFNGVIFPTDHGGRAVDDFSSLGLTAKAAIAKSELRYGTLAPQLPILISSDRLVLQTFTGAQVESRDIDRLTLTLGQLEHAKGRGSSNEQGLSMSGANNARTGVTSNKFYYGGGIYKPRADWTLQYYYANLQDFYRQHFFGLKHSLPVGPANSPQTFVTFAAWTTARINTIRPTTPSAITVQALTRVASTTISTAGSSTMPWGRIPSAPVTSAPPARAIRYGSTKAMAPVPTS